MIFRCTWGVCWSRIFNWRSASTRSEPARRVRRRRSFGAVRPKRYRRIFASYAHADTDIVARIQGYARALGDEYLIDAVNLRAGENWNDALRAMIEQADVFQLFWSWSSMTSQFVRQEWEHALSLDRPNFVRPTYWQLPMPSSPEKALPPVELAKLHFQHIATHVPESKPRDSAGHTAPATARSLGWLASGATTLLLLGIGAVGVLRSGASPTDLARTVAIEPEPAPASANAPPAVAVEPTAVATGTRPSSKPQAGGKSHSADPGGLSGLGSSHGPDGPSGATVGTGQIDGSQIQSTVARYVGSVKRACWQQALSSRTQDAPPSARVNVTIIVAPSGAVQSATTGGEPKGYPGLSQCIASRVRGWQFPPSGDTTTVNVPFVFEAASSKPTPNATSL